MWIRRLIFSKKKIFFPNLQQISQCNSVIVDGFDISVKLLNCLFGFLACLWNLDVEIPDAEIFCTLFWSCFFFFGSLNNPMYCKWSFNKVTLDKSLTPFLILEKYLASYNVFIVIVFVGSILPPLISSCRLSKLIVSYRIWNLVFFVFFIFNSSYQSNESIMGCFNSTNISSSNFFQPEIL